MYSQFMAHFRYTANAFVRQIASALCDVAYVYMRA